MKKIILHGSIESAGFLSAKAKKAVGGTIITQVDAKS